MGKKRKIYEITPEVYIYYTKNVKWNEYTSVDQVRRKLSRNIQLTREHMPDRITRHLATTTYKYGNLHIRKRFGKIIGLENHYGETVGYKVDEQRYIELSREYGIIL